MSDFELDIPYGAELMSCDRCEKNLAIVSIWASGDYDVDTLCTDCHNAGAPEKGKITEYVDWKMEKIEKLKNKHDEEMRKILRGA